jgi:L-asparaginase/Glu-tRNA(Gln) amidotransferase subunit D
LSYFIDYINYIIPNQKSHFFTGYKWGYEGKHDYNVKAKDRKILLIYTGGTIRMVETEKGNMPKKGFLQKKLKSILN